MKAVVGAGLECFRAPQAFRSLNVKCGTFLLEHLALLPNSRNEK